MRWELSPVSDRAIRPLVLITVFLTAVASFGAVKLGVTPALIALALIGLLLSATWPLLANSPTPVLTSGVLAFATAGVVWATWLVQPQTDHSGFLWWLPAVIAAGTLTSFLTQVVRLELPHLIAAVSAATSGLLMLAATSALAATAHTQLSRRATALVMVSAIVSLVGDLLVPNARTRPLSGIVAALAGGLAAFLVALWFMDVASLGAAILGMFAASVSAAFRRIFSAHSSIVSWAAQIAVGVGSVVLLGGVAQVWASLGLIGG